MPDRLAAYLAAVAATRPGNVDAWVKAVAPKGGKK